MGTPPEPRGPAARKEAAPGLRRGTGRRRRKRRPRTGPRVFVGHPHAGGHPGPADAGPSSRRTPPRGVGVQAGVRTSRVERAHRGDRPTRPPGLAGLQLRPRIVPPLYLHRPRPPLQGPHRSGTTAVVRAGRRRPLVLGGRPGPRVSAAGDPRVARGAIDTGHGKHRAGLRDTQAERCPADRGAPRGPRGRRTNTSQARRVRFDGRSPDDGGDGGGRRRRGYRPGNRSR
mmetsp:Transcript_4295/g.9377  ORF Transcript_4295/g.9377 Transcript_4295/m.9377 type:complete len:229 (-) Transcript_4295:150-836(-)